MAISTQMEDFGYSSVAKIGRVWFKYRSLSPLPLFLLLVLLPSDFAPSFAVAAVAALVIALSEGLRLWSVGHAGSATRTRGDNVPALVHAGPYRHVRNPLYIGNIAMYTAAAVLFGNSTLSLLIFIFSTLEYIFIVAFEEETLRRIFGSPYEIYCSKVSRWLPSPKPTCESSGQEFSIQRALRSERSTFYCMALMAVLYLAHSLLYR